MPNFDKTGPVGAGAKTGGQMGKCTDAKSQERPFDGRGEGRGGGMRKRQLDRGKTGRGPRARFSRRNSDT